MNYAFMGLIPEPSRLIEETAPEIAHRLRDDGVDAVFLAATCPVCCRSVGLIARAIEAAGIPTVITMMYQQMANAIKAPRIVHALFPFGQPLGEPENPDHHRIIIEDALHLLVTASESGAVVHLPYRWGLEDYQKIRVARGNILAH
jgi:D-proline reductase (dithiol) PrdB